MSRRDSGHIDDEDLSRPVMIDTTQQNAGENVGLLSDNGDRANLRSGGTDDFQASAKGGYSEQASRQGARQHNQPISKDSFQTGSRQSEGLVADAADIPDSDSDENQGVPAVMDFDKPNLPKEGYSTFAEADAAADAYGSGPNSNANKSGFRNSKPSDNFARVTWTDLASNRKNNIVIDPQGLGEAKRRGTMRVNPETSAFSLAN